MPIYEYRCHACGARFDDLAKRYTDKPEACPECGADRPRKLFSAFSPKMGTGPMSTAPSACSTGTCCPTGSCSLQ